MSKENKNEKDKGTKKTVNTVGTDLPLDYSFCDLTCLADVLDHEPRESKKKSKKKTESGKSASKSLKLNNNKLQDLAGIKDVMEKLFDQPKDITWLDLSFNEITTIDEELNECSNLKFLYLHGNQIANLAEVDKLGCLLPNLQKLTLHGNLIEKEKTYRSYIISKLPALRELDFSIVTKADRATSATLEKLCGFNKKAKKKVEVDE